uniref:Uncharacterized protein n=1 Tax=viral metagenome TaxID=1070528 RepID=A0A6H1ZRZ1_9ZZZZ
MHVLAIIGCFILLTPVIIWSREVGIIGYVLGIATGLILRYLEKEGVLHS